MTKYDDRVAQRKQTVTRREEVLSEMNLKDFQEVFED
jgi:hypothetical protein